MHTVAIHLQTPVFRLGQSQKYGQIIWDESKTRGFRQTLIAIIKVVTYLVHYQKFLVIARSDFDMEIWFRVTCSSDYCKIINLFIICEVLFDWTMFHFMLVLFVKSLTIFAMNLITLTVLLFVLFPFIFILFSIPFHMWSHSHVCQGDCHVVYFT